MNILTKKELARRDASNARRRLLLKSRKDAGQCQCGKPAEKNPKGGLYCQCKACRRKNNAISRQAYHTGPKGRPPRQEPPMDRRLKDRRGVRRRYVRDGMGREAWWWLASMVVSGRPKLLRFSVDKHGDLAAFRLAVKCREEWERAELL